MSLSIKIPNAVGGNQVRKSDDSPTTALNERPTLNLPGKLELPKPETPLIRRNSQNASLSPTTAVTTSPTLLVPGMSGPNILSRRSSFASNASDTDSIPGDMFQTLQTLPFFAGAASTQDFIQEIGTAMKIRHYKPGDVVIKYGDVAKTMFLIIRGELGIMSEDNEIEYATLGAGSFVGEIGVLFNSVRTATVVSKTKSLMGALTADVLQKKLEMFPDIKELLQSKGKERLQALEAAKKKGGASPLDQKEQRAKEIKRQPSLRVNHNLIRTPSFRVLNSEDDEAAHSPFSASWSFSVQPPSNLETSGEFLGIPDDMSQLKNRASSRRSSIIPPMGEMFHIEDTTITVNPTEPKLNRSLSRKSFNQEIEDTEEPPFIPPLLRSTSRRKSSIRFELGSLAKEVEDRESEDIMAQAQKRLSDMLMAIPAPVQISGSTEEISFSVPTLPSIQIEVPELKIAEPVTEDEPVTLIVPDLPSFQFQDMDDEYVLKEESISKESNASAGSSESTPDSEEAVEEDDQFDESESLSSSPTVGRKVYRQSDSVDVAPRRISIAVWTDQKLMKKVNKKKDELAKMPSILGKRAEVVMSPIQDEEETVPLSPNTQSRFDQRREAVFLSVCKHLNLQELGRLRQTCSRTSDLILESLPTSVKHMDLNAFRKQITDKSLAHVVKFYGYQIESLDLTACWQLTDKGLETLAKNCPSLTSLKLNEVWEISNYGIKMISRNCAQLKNIDLSNCKNLTNEGVHHLLANCSSLETISLSYCKALSSSLMDHENWSQIKKLNLHRCTGVADRGFELWTTLIEEEDMWAQSRSLAASREWLENDTEQLGELSRSENMGNTGDMNESFNAGSDEDEVMEREPNPESNEGLGLDSKDDGGQQLGGKDLGATLAVKDHSQSGKHSSMSLAEGSWSKITSFQDLAGGSSAATPNVLARLSQESLNQDRDPDNVREFSESSPTSASRLSLNQGGLGPMILIEDSQGEDVYESSSEIDERKTGFLLQSLTLRDCSFLTDSSIASLASVCGHLRLLNLSFCCSLTEEFARHLVKGCSKLVALDVSFCGGAVTDYTLLHLSTGLQKLKALSIRGCVQVSDVGIDHLHANSTRLSVLNVTQCKNISPELLLKLKRAWTLLDTESVCDYVERSPKLCTLDYSQPAHK